jgi:serine/threonine protein kinase
MPLSIGDKLGPYEILAPIGKGGMGDAYRAQDTRLRREVAVKVLPQSFATEAARERFQREAAPLRRSIIPISGRFTTSVKRRAIHF